MPKTTEFNLILRIGKPEAEISNNERLLYREARSIVWPVYDSRATFYFIALSVHIIVAVHI